ncbi:MAG: hypothetical protein AB2L20_03680 [Mangrovibacterium sp.]
MIIKNYSVYTTEKSTFEQMCQSLLMQIGRKRNVIKIVYFGIPQNNEEYLHQFHQLRGYTKAYFPDRPPLISYVAQKPFVGMLNAEVVFVEEIEKVRISPGENYVVLENGICRELVTGGILPPDISASVSDQSNAVFSRIEQILTYESFPINSILRQWNYIEGINVFRDSHQHYQDFNDSRSQFYAKTNWPSGYPAATGIGTQFGGVMVEIFAFTGEELVNRALDNPLQVAAHKYSQDVLLGATEQRATPKFERARVIGTSEKQIVFISGTAAIRGELSLHADDVIEQVRVIMDNIDCLISSANYLSVAAMREYKLLRIYIKNPDQIETVHNYMDAHYPDVKKLYVCADVCRDELLLELEGIAEIKGINPLI